MKKCPLQVKIVIEAFNWCTRRRIVSKFSYYWPKSIAWFITYSHEAGVNQLMDFSYFLAGYYLLKIQSHISKHLANSMKEGY